MTVSSMTDGNWGVARERARKGRRWKISGAMVAFGFALLLLPHDASAQTKAIVMVGWMGIVLIGGALSWRDRDEVERRLAINSFAAMGFTALILYPVVRTLAPLLSISDVGMTVWAISVIAVPIAYIAQRLRR